MASRCLLLLVALAAAQTGNAFAPRYAIASHGIFSRSSGARTTSDLRAIVDEVSDEMKAAMKRKDTTTLATIRLIRSAFANAAIDLKTEKLTDEQAQGALRKMAKMRQESIDMYMKGGAEERADAERAELAVIERWLPKLADEEQTREWVQDAIKEAGPDNMGKVMGALMKAHKAELDGNLAQKVVKEELAKS
mmetsp:Transcript_12493/g.25949  ORF Transcript_12493/g.25949 Transcript_12493/m.25949 type:complete len:193 (-) Transcript_12493:25-603(-)|eukprot:CAMPEP_0183326466 /NCGR_PEP_ID=MMETSP0160_2-20130417/82246_1 /TAXON_ID=2839 ORGANISM="Odontella Sinensis, Strain Grunow 1884" /NCGR_SAMPLE_ID=MMETSP0160_2 /ASSEMBLY_ACC=CAM_ASM_000250 /LENGTH=192 /DNA_ID=CAMNT_0025494457 /DNA_START=70 /DNA_END=648 /DNA_ORIENTATION=+